MFTSDSETPAAGDWVGLYLDASPPAGNKLTYAQVLYAGADSQTSSYGCGPGDNDAAILITDWRPDDAFIQNVEIGASAGSGIMSGWSSDADGPDLKSGNVFSEIANGCDVSRWKNATDTACPGRTDERPSASNKARVEDGGRSVALNRGRRVRRPFRTERRLADLLAARSWRSGVGQAPRAARGQRAGRRRNRRLRGSRRPACGVPRAWCGRRIRGRSGR